MAQGEMPSGEIITGVMLLVAGVLLVTPGFVTDFFGLSLLLPAVRSALIKSVQQHLVASQGTSSHTRFYSSELDPMNNSSETKSPDSLIKNHKGETLEGEFERKD